MIPEKAMCYIVSQKSSFHSFIIHPFDKYLLSAYSTCSSIKTERMRISILNPCNSFLKCLTFVNLSLPDLGVSLTICEYNNSKSSRYGYV